MKAAKEFFLHECHKCGVCDEAKFVHTGPHIKQVCNDCGFYVKFFDKTKIPDVHEIKQKIFFICDGDISVIDQAKKDCEFIDGLTGLNQKLMYWKLYLQVKSIPV